MVDIATQTTTPSADVPMLVINEVLCFLQNWLNDHTHESISKLCCDFYTQTEITQAKDILFSNVTTKRRKIKRKGTEKSKLDVQDMMIILLELEVPHSVLFVAKNLARIPPRDRDTFDIMHANKEIDELKSIVQQLCNNQIAITRMVKLNSSTPSTPLGPRCRGTRDMGTVTSSAGEELATGWNTPNRCNDKDSHYQPLGAGLPASASASASTPTQQAPDISSSQMRTSASPADHESVHVNPSSLSQYIVIDSIADDSESHTENSPMHSTILQSTFEEPSTRWADVLGSHRVTRRRAPHHNAPNRVLNNSRSHDIRRNPKSDVTIGKAPKTCIEAVSDTRGNRQCTGLFVSRLKPGTSCAQLAVFIHRECGYLMRPEKIPTKSAEYCSFYLWCNREKRQVLLNSDIWPRGAVVKPFYSY